MFYRVTLSFNSTFMKKVFLLLAALAGLASCHKTGNKQADDLAKACRNMGIASFFFGVILFSIFTIRLCCVYKKQYGSHSKESKAGLICGILSLIIWTIGITLGILWYLNYSK